MFYGLLQDLRYAWRGVVTHPAFSLIAAGSLALGVSTVAGVFTVLDAAYGSGVPFANADRLVALYVRSGPDPENRQFNLQAAELQQVMASSGQLASIAPYKTAFYTVRTKDWATHLITADVTPAFTSMLGARTIVGRSFAPGDDESGASPVAILSYGLWASEFGAKREIVGQSIEIDGRLHEIVGVMSRETGFPDDTQLWTVKPLRRVLGDTARLGLHALALLKRGVTPAQATAELAVIGGRVDQPLPPGAKSVPLIAMSFHQYLALNVRALVLVMTTLGTIIGVIAAANFAALVLARGMRRREELGIRAALGASPRRLVWNVLAECLLVSIAGGAVGAFAAPLTVRLLGATILPHMVPPWLHATWGAWGALMAVAIAVTLGLVFGLSPAIELAAPAAAGFLRGGAGAAAGAKRQGAHRRALVAFQVALATGPIVFVGAIARDQLSLRTPSTGLDEENLFVGFVQYNGPGAKKDPGPARASMLDAVRSVPGVVAADVFDSRYLRPTEFVVVRSGPTSADVGDRRYIQWQQVGPQYFAAAGHKLISGRMPTDVELARGDPVALVTARLAKEWIGDVHAGWRVELTTSRSTKSAYSIVGVVADFNENAFDRAASLVILTPFSTDRTVAGEAYDELWIRAAPETRAVILNVYAALKHIDPGTTVADLMPMRERTRLGARELRSVTIVVLTVFGIALSLSALGIYGMIAYAAVMRRKEVAIRLALGASRTQLASLVLGEATRQTILGLVFGLLGGITAAIYFTDGSTVLHAPPIGTTGLIVLVLAATVLVAAVGPIRRVWRVDTAGVLREEA
jgi:predicted permease